jgi:hypothetical protein
VHIDGFALRPDKDNPGFFDNAPDHTVSFWGVYATRSLPRKASLDLYYLGLDRKAVTFQRGTAQEVRHSLGARISRPIATEHSGWDYDAMGRGPPLRNEFNPLFSSMKVRTCLP